MALFDKPCSEDIVLCSEAVALHDMRIAKIVANISLILRMVIVEGYMVCRKVRD